MHIIDGQIVINKDTLTVQAQEAGAPRTIVSGLSQTLNNNSYATNRTSSERWLPEETENFYNVRSLPTSLGQLITFSFWHFFGILFEVITFARNMTQDHWSI